MTPESKTPLTDAEYASYPILDTQKGGDAVRISFARSLERKLAAHTAAAQAMEDALARFIDRLSDAQISRDLVNANVVGTLDEIIKEMRAALAKAKEAK